MQIDPRESEACLSFFTALSPLASYTVKFYDGVIQKVKGIHVKPFIKQVKILF